MRFDQIFPIAQWLPNYSSRDFRADFIAGLTVGVMLVPQGMAYGLLAGLPPIYGLYSGILPLFLYAFFGTSRQLSVGPVALVSLLILSGVGAFAEPGTDYFVTLAISTALIAGVIQILLGLFRLGFLVNFLSHPVISGFTSAAALIIAFSQTANLLGIQAPRSNIIHEILGYIIAHLTEVHLLTLGLGLGGIVFMLLVKKLHKSIPNALVTVIVGTILVWYFQLDQQGVQIVGVVPKGLPTFSIPKLDWQILSDLFPLALTICIISFIESLAIAKTIESQHKEYKVVPNQELFALGLTKIGGAFFQSFPTTGSFTRSAVNNEAGAKTGMASIISAVLISLTLLFLTPLFYFLPKALLASIIVVAVRNLIDYKEAIHLWKTDKKDFISLIGTFLATLTLGIQIGVLTGLILSLLLIIYKASRPQFAVLGRLPDTKTFRNVLRFPEAIEEPGIKVVRFDSQLFFGNAEFFRESMEDLITAPGQPRAVVLDASIISSIDSTGIQVFKGLIHYYHNHQVQFLVSGLIGPVRDTLHRNNLLQLIGERNIFLRAHDAVTFLSNTPDSTPQNPIWSQEAIQTNLKNP